MADITPTQVKILQGSVQQVTLGEDVTVLGSLLTRDYTTGNYLLADANVAGLTAIHGIAETTGLNGSDVTMIRPGAILDIGVVLSGPATYWILSANPGAIAPLADLAAGWNLSQVGIAESTSILRFIVNNTGIVA